MNEIIFEYITIMLWGALSISLAACGLWAYAAYVTRRDTVKKNEIQERKK